MFSWKLADGRVAYEQTSGLYVFQSLFSWKLADGAWEMEKTVRNHMVSILVFLEVSRRQYWQAKARNETVFQSLFSWKLADGP